MFRFLLRQFSIGKNVTSDNDIENFPLFSYINK